MIKKMLLPLAGAVVLSSCSLFEKTTKKASGYQPVQQTAIVKTDTVKKSINPYKEVITSKAITDEGLFKVHKVDERYYFEIPDSTFNKDMLIVNRISRGPANASGNAGDWIGEGVFQFSLGSMNKILMRRMYYRMKSSENGDNNDMREAVFNTNMQPIAASFDIKAFAADSSAVVIDMTDFINSDNDIMNFDQVKRVGLQIDGYKADRSFIEKISAFPENIEIKSIKTYAGKMSGGFTSYELNSSILLLPIQPMQSRSFDKRVGYFGRAYYNFDASRPVLISGIITRWRLEPKDEDIEKYKRGELVEPKKPIVYYIDPATPKKWVPYLIQGVNDWQKAFEKAGFKNAIYAIEAAIDDSTWSIDDARHSVIIYKASEIENASGPMVSDPRSGEILESHIDWNHNIQRLMHDWYMVQAGPNDPKARKMQFDDSLMGRLIRYVCSHEVGHTLGLKHNFLASSTVPVDSLRSKQYVKANGYCPSIMDYARFNYVAQPEDGFEEEELIPRINVYDNWAIEWGYKWFPAFKSKEDEELFMKKWVTKRIGNDRRLWFGDNDKRMQDRTFSTKSQTEDLGDDAMKAGYFGIQNLKRVISAIMDWTSGGTNEGYENLGRIYDEVVEQYQRYMYHAANNIGGRTWIQKNSDQDGEGTNFNTGQQQKSAIKFLHDELFTTPKWLLNDEIYRLTAGEGIFYVNGGNMYRLLRLQFNVLLKITSYQAYGNLLSQQTTTNSAYVIDELLTDLETGIWKELNSKAPFIDIYRRNLQKIYVTHLIRQLDTNEDQLIVLDNVFFSYENVFTDVQPIIKSHLKTILANISTSIVRCKDKLSRGHLIEVRDRIINALKGSTDKIVPPTTEKDREKNTFYLFDSLSNLKVDYRDDEESTECWFYERKYRK